MKALLLLLFFTLLVFEITAQTDTTSNAKTISMSAFYDADPACDSINGSGIKINSITNTESFKNGYQLIYFDMMPCDMDIDIKDLKRRISFNKITQDTLTIDIATIATCCIDVLGELQVKKNDTLNLRFESCKNGCLCMCCYTLRYQIKSEKELYNLNFQLNGKPIKESPHLCIQRRSEIDTLVDGTTIYKLFEDDLIKVKRINYSNNKKEVLRIYKEGILALERVTTKNSLNQKLKISKRFKNTELYSEHITDESNNIVIRRKYHYGKLIKESKETIVK